MQVQRKLAVILTLATALLTGTSTVCAKEAAETVSEPGRTGETGITLTGSVFPEASPEGDASETYRVWRAFWQAQEADFPNPPDDSWKERLWASYEDYVHPDVILHNVPNSHDRASWAAFGELLGVAYPDSQTTFDLVVVEGDLVAASWTYRGTHLKPLGDHPPTGKKIQVNGMMFSRVREGKIVEHWSLVDKLSWLKQIGVIDESIGM